MEYEKKYKSGTSTTAKVAAALGGTALGVSVLNGGGILNGGGLLNGLVGPRYAAPPVALAAAEQAAYQGGYVTEKELCLVREISGKDSTIAQLTAEKYTDMAVKAATDPLNVRVCNLETAAAVNAARDVDFRRYVNSEFVHQPKASIRESIVTCQQCGCECNCNCGHNHGFDHGHNC